MLKLRVAELLEERNKTKYWLAKKIDMSYQNFDRMLKNETVSIRYSVIEALCDKLNCSIEDLFVQVEDPEVTK